eukprot:TRINITY_DN26564_c0_g1_i1.p1 TRINITY_DN26564_c0_g1~~TRINITY_DN26564_c0_g1_i1.p1  ORF type:complete len:819 (-),score=145.94 TRINITY_DN26564_c0_g1_i1:56-2512(-)
MPRAEREVREGRGRERGRAGEGRTGANPQDDESNGRPSSSSSSSRESSRLHLRGDRRMGSGSVLAGRHVAAANSREGSCEGGDADSEAEADPKADGASSPRPSPRTRSPRSTSRERDFGNKPFDREEAGPVRKQRKKPSDQGSKHIGPRGSGGRAWKRQASGDSPPRSGNLKAGRGAAGAAAASVPGAPPGSLAEARARLEGMNFGAGLPKPADRMAMQAMAAQIAGSIRQRSGSAVANFGELPSMRDRNARTAALAQPVKMRPSSKTRALRVPAATKARAVMPERIGGRQRPELPRRRRAASSGSRGPRNRRLVTTGPRTQGTQPSTTRLQPSEETCYAYCLARRIDLERLEKTLMEQLRQKALARAKAQAGGVPRSQSAVAPSGGRGSLVDARGKIQNRSSSSASSLTGRGSASRRSSDPAGGYNVFVVPLNKDLKLMKVGHKDCFVYSFGCLVCWGCRLEEAEAAKQALRPFLEDPLAPQNIDEDHIDFMQCEPGSMGLGGLFGGSSSSTKEKPKQERLSSSSASAVLPSPVFLSSRDPPTFERVALAYALAQSVRLGSLELRIDKWIGQTRQIPEQMAQDGQTTLSSQQVTKMTGELFTLKHEVNLDTDILDTPDFFWDYGDYEPLYTAGREHMDLDQRVSVLNQRFEVLQDMLDVLENELNERHGTRMTWIIIVLCALEAAVMGLRLYSRVLMPLSKPHLEQQRHHFGHHWRVTPILSLLVGAWQHRAIALMLCICATLAAWFIGGYSMPWQIRPPITLQSAVFAPAETPTPGASPEGHSVPSDSGSASPQAPRSPLLPRVETAPAAMLQGMP